MISKISIPFSDALGEKVTNNILMNILDIIDETFLFTADEDYLNARFLAFNQHHRSFYWSAAQCLEKYLKANLLLLGISVSDFGHDIENMYQELTKIDSSLSKRELIVPEQLIEIKALWGKRKIGNFVSLVSKHGHPDNRYDYVGVSIEPSTLFKLDQLVYILRNKITESGLYKHCKLSPELQKYLLDNNFKFAPSSYQHSSIYEINTCFRLKTSKLEAVLNNCHGHKEIYKHWLKDNIKIEVNAKKFIK